MDLDDPKGSRATKFEDLARMGKNHFKNLYKAPSKETLTGFISLDRSFPGYMDKYNNQ